MNEDKWQVATDITDISIVKNFDAAACTAHAN